MLCRGIYASEFEIKKYKIPNQNLIKVEITRFNYIKICSILDELDILNSYAKNDEFLKGTLYVVAPAIRAIKTYTGFRKTRNSIYAHFNRDKRKKFYPFWKVFRDAKIPFSKSELDSVYSYLHGINGILVTRYYDDFNQFSEIASDELISFQSWLNAAERKSPEKSYYESINSEIEKRMKEKKIDGIIVDPFMTEIIKRAKRVNYS